MFVRLISAMIAIVLAGLGGYHYAQVSYSNRLAYQHESHDAGLQGPQTTSSWWTETQPTPLISHPDEISCSDRPGWWCNSLRIANRFFRKCLRTLKSWSKTAIGTPPAVLSLVWTVHSVGGLIAACLKALKSREESTQTDTETEQVSDDQTSTEDTEISDDEEKLDDVNTWLYQTDAFGDVKTEETLSDRDTGRPCGDTPRPKLTARSVVDSSDSNQGETSQPFHVFGRPSSCRVDESIFTLPLTSETQDEEETESVTERTNYSFPGSEFRSPPVP